MSNTFAPDEFPCELLLNGVPVQSVRIRQGWENATNQPCKSGSFDLLLHILDASDGFINLLLSIRIKQLRMCRHLVSHLVQNSQHVTGFIGQAVHDASIVRF
jgi:hypothetical protein